MGMNGRDCAKYQNQDKMGHIGNSCLLKQKEQNVQGKNKKGSGWGL